MSTSSPDHPASQGWKALLLAIVFPFWKPKGRVARELTHITFQLYFYAAAGILVAAYLAEQNRAAAIIYALASAAAGSAVGFLFGFPRTVPQAAAEGQPSGGARQKVNTNLEDVSDWLTKIIVGVGLVEGRDLARGFGELAREVNDDLRMHGGAAAAGSVLVYFAVVGFFYGYLSTRLFLAGTFLRADNGASEEPANG